MLELVTAAPIAVDDGCLAQVSHKGPHVPHEHDVGLLALNVLVRRYCMYVQLNTSMHLTWSTIHCMWEPMTHLW